MTNGSGVDDSRRQNLLKLASAAVFLAVIAVAVLIVVSSGDGGGDASDIQGAAEVERQLQGLPQEGLIIGKPEARVKLVEFGDLKCPVCASYASDVLPEVIESQVRSGKARVEFRSFVIIDQEESTAAGAAAIAAGEQGRGWNFVEIFYENQGNEASPYVSDDFLTAVAEAAGVEDIQRWDRDRQSAATIAAVERSSEEAEGLGFTGTPSFAVEGPGTGSEGLETFEAYESPVEQIEAAIAGAS